jgi:hypothetical protein
MIVLNICNLQDFQSYIRRRPVKDLDLRYIVECLNSDSSLGESTVVRLFLALQDSLIKSSDAALTEFLSLMPQCFGGIMPIASGMFHPRWEVRRASTRILWRLDWHKVSTHNHIFTLKW